MNTGVSARAGYSLTASQADSILALLNPLVASPWMQAKSGLAARVACTPNKVIETPPLTLTPF